MEKKYNSNSLRSILFKLIIRLSKFKNNTKTIASAIKYIEKCKNKKYNPNIFKNMQKNQYHDCVYYSNNETQNENILLYIHGGSFVDNIMKIQLDFVKKVASRINAELVVPLYKTMPNGNCDNFLIEMSELCKSLKEKNKRIFLIGDSAGGGGVLSLNMFLLEQESNIIDGVILLSPWLDVSLENIEIKDKAKKDIVCSVDGNKFLGKKWAGNINVKDYRVSPLYGNVDGLKRVFISCGGYEICQPDCIKLAKILKDKNIKYKFIEFKKQIHNFELYPTKESKIIVDEISNFIMEEN